MGQFEKTVSIDKQLGELASKFDRAYGLWLSGDLSVPSSSATPDSKGVRPRANRVETRSDLPDQPIRGFINETLFLKNFLLKRKESEEFKTLAIVGKFGVGKTTLCQDVFNNEDGKQAYLPRIWVSMFSEETKEDEDPRIAVVKRILRSLGVEDEMFEHIKTEAKEEKQNKVEEGKTDEETVEEKELSRLLSCLNSNLIGKKYLIVLDDVWEDNKWSQRLDEENIQQEKWHLSCGFPKGSGGRVIVTSRDERLAKEIVGQEENLQRLFPRSDAESVLEIYNDAFEKYMEDAVEKLIKAILGEPGPGGSVKVAVEKLMKGAAGEPMKVAVEKLLKGAAGEYMKGVVETLMKDAGGELKEDTDGNKKILKIVVNPRYPGRYKQELMDKSCGIPWVAQKLAKIKPLKMDEDQDK